MQKLLAFCHKQNTVEVITDVVHSHGKRHLAEQLLQSFLRHAKNGAKTGSFLHQRKIFGGQCLQCEFGFATLQNQLALTGFQTDGLIGRHGAQNVDQFARAHCGGEVAGIAVHFSGGANLDFKIAGGQLQSFTSFADQHIGQNRQCVTTLNDARNGLQNRQQFVLGGLQYDHVFLCFRGPRFGIREPLDFR